MLSVSGLEKHLGGRAILSNASFHLGAGEKVALVGVNGSGKTTLMRICAREIDADAGEVSLPRDASIAYLPQHADLKSDRSLFEELRSVFEHVDRYISESEELAHRMAEVDHDSDEYRRVADRYGHLQHEIDRLGAYEIDARIEKVLAGLGFKPSDRDRPCTEFSGGWQMRILLARLMLNNHDVLLLDEPTNHLDLETMIWFENWVRESAAAVLLVSHERTFMDKVATRVFEVHESQLTIYQGNYTDYLKTRGERWSQWQREYDNQREEIARVQRFINRFRYNNVKAPLVQSRIKMLEKIKRIAPPPKLPATIHFRFPAPERSHKEVFEVKAMNKAYGDNEVLKGVDLTLWRGEKVALVGLNGAGKTTLLKVLRGAEPPTSGEVVRGSRAKLEYFAQYDVDGLGEERTVWQEIASVAPTGHLEQARNLLGGFFFIGEDVDKPTRVLSGGEKTRLRLAKMLFSGANVLLLDEPTNHLDIASRATLEKALRDYEGTIVLVSHDRTFLDALATRILEIKDGRVRSFPGNYTDYCLALEARGETSPLVESSPRRTSSKREKSTAPSGTRRPAAIAKRGKKKGKAEDRPVPRGEQERQERRQSDREQRRIKKLVAELEREIAKIERRLGEIDDELARPEVYRDHTKSVPLADEKAKLKEHHATYMQQWERQAASVQG